MQRRQRVHSRASSREGERLGVGTARGWEPLLGCHADSVWVPLCKLIPNRYLFVFAKQRVQKHTAPVLVARRAHSEHPVAPPHGTGMTLTRPPGIFKPLRSLQPSRKQIQAMKTRRRPPRPTLGQSHQNKHGASTQRSDSSQELLVFLIFFFLLTFHPQLLDVRFDGGHPQSHGQGAEY